MTAVESCGRGASAGVVAPLPGTCSFNLQKSVYSSVRLTSSNKESSRSLPLVGIVIKPGAAQRTS